MSLGHALAPVVSASRQRPLPGDAPATVSASGERYWKLTAFLTGLGSQLFVRLIGYLAFTEVFFLVMLPLKVRAVTAAATSTPTATIFTILGVLWIIGSVVADVVNGSPFDILARGVSRSVFLVLDVVCLLALWRRRPEKIEFFLIGYPLSLLASRYVFKSGAEEWLGAETTNFSDWKANTSYLVVGVLFLVVARYYRRAPLLVAAITFVTGIFFTGMGSRAFGLSQILAAVLMVVFPGGARSGEADLVAVARKRQVLVFKIAVGVLIGLATIYGAGKAYKAATRAGWLGQQELEKLEEQDRTKGGVLVGGRFGFFVGLWAATHKPFIGHGSWPLDTYGYTGQAADLFEIDTRDVKIMTKRLYWIPCHSAVVGGWVEHGIFGLLFWLFVLYVLFVNFPRAAVVFPAQAGLCALIFSDLIWHVLFSPAGHRVILAAKIVSMLLVDEAWRRQTRLVRQAVGERRLTADYRSRLSSAPGAT
jgi:hypothetical protein